jgi:hypothetical protein
MPLRAFSTTSRKAAGRGGGADNAALPTVSAYLRAELGALAALLAARRRPGVADKHQQTAAIEDSGRAEGSV